MDLEGAVYHIYGRGNRKNDIFLDDLDRRSFLASLAKALRKTDAVLYAWALLPNHFHLLLKRGVFRLAETMHALLTRHAGRFNERHGTVGHLFQNRFEARLCDSDEHFLTLLRYVHRNPLKHGVVPDLAALRGYPWTGHPAFLGKKRFAFHAVEEALEALDSDNERALSSYLSAMEEGDARGTDAAPEASSPTGREIPDRERLVRAANEILGLVAGEFGLSREALLSKRRNEPLPSARTRFAILARARLQMSGSDIARIFRVSPAAACKWLGRG